MFFFRTHTHPHKTTPQMFNTIAIELEYMVHYFFFLIFRKFISSNEKKKEENVISTHMDAAAKRKQQKIQQAKQK